MNCTKVEGNEKNDEPARRFVAVTRQGKRPYNEDRYLCKSRLLGAGGGAEGGFCEGGGAVYKRVRELGGTGEERLVRSGVPGVRGEGVRGQPGGQPGPPLGGRGPARADARPQTAGDGREDAHSEARGKDIPLRAGRFHLLEAALRVAVAGFRRVVRGLFFLGGARDVLEDVWIEGRAIADGVVGEFFEGAGGRGVGSQL
ncbi:unnamed protein product [Sphagnum balticum]